MPIVASMGGVAGTQTLTLIVRGLALGQIERANARWLLTKEIAVAMLNGVAWARSWRWWPTCGSSSGASSAVIFAAMVINLLAAAFAGVAVPLCSSAWASIRRSPAASSSRRSPTSGFASLLGLGTLLLL